MPRGVEFTDQQRSVLSALMKTAWSHHKGDEHPKMTRRWVNPIYVPVDTCVAEGPLEDIKEIFKENGIEYQFVEKPEGTEVRVAKSDAPFARELLKRVRKGWANPVGSDLTKTVMGLVKKNHLRVFGHYVDSRAHGGGHKLEVWGDADHLRAFLRSVKDLALSNYKLVNLLQREAIIRWVDPSQARLKGRQNPGAAWHKTQEGEVEREIRMSGDSAYLRGQRDAHHLSVRASEWYKILNPALTPVKAYRCPVCKDYVYMSPGQIVARCGTCKAKVGRRVDRNP